MKNKASVSRRDALKRAAAAMAAPYVIASAALGNGDAVAPSNRIGIGLIGVGMMGRGHLRVCLQYPEAQVLAVCDVDQWRRETAKQTVEETYAAAQPDGKYRGCRAYNDLRGRGKGSVLRI